MKKKNSGWISHTWINKQIEFSNSRIISFLILNFNYLENKKIKQISLNISLTAKLHKFFNTRIFIIFTFYLDY